MYTMPHYRFLYGLYVKFCNDVPFITTNLGCPNFGKRIYPEIPFLGEVGHCSYTTALQMYLHSPL